ncbi:MAG: autotransporter adhesin family protein [Clostridia bacterium]|nr:autotransporter adhesin family protein [Clostridia bacterium]
MNGGTISGNGALGGGGVYVYTDGTFEMNGGEITGHVVNNGAAAVSVYNGGLFTMNDGKITGNTTVGSSSGGAIYLHPTSVFTMNGGLIANNTEMNQAGGAISVNGATFNMNGGEISGNTATQGGAIYLNNYAGLTDSALTAKFNMNGGKISGNTATGNGGAVFADPYTTFTMTDGEITNNIAANGGGVYNKGMFILSGGTITENRATSLGGGIYVTSEATLDLSGSPMVYGNSANGDENNIYLVDAKTIAVTGMLAVNGMIAYLGVTMADPSKKKFTLGFASHNSDYNPDLRPETVFFSDNTDYMVSLEDGEAVLVTNDYSQTSLVWQVSKDGGASWITVDAPYYSLRYKAGETYAVRALDGEGNVIPFTWATDANGDINANSFSGIGSYKFVINSEDYLNPSLTFEVLPAQLFWQYSTDEGRTWLDITSNSLVYTSATYQVRACVYDNGYVVIQSFADTMKDVGDYEYTVDDVDLYENPTLNFKITTRYITVDWNFGDALGNATDGYYWNYNGLVHTPIAVLNGVSSELAGIDLSYGYLWNGTTGYSSAQAFAGTYTLTVGLQNADPNVVLSNTTVTFKINAVTLSLEWVDEDGNSGDEFTFEYDNEPHGVDFILNGVITGDVVGAYITYATRSGKILSEAPTAVGYYTATVKLPADCYNYVFDKTYTCQIVITQKEVAVQWQPNTDGTFVWTFNGLGKGPVVSIINPYTGEELNEPYKIEYAPVASNGNIGQYTTTQPVNAGNYIVRVTLNNPDANYVLDADTATQKFTIEKLGVTITWSGATYDPDKDVYFWEYDGNEHDLEAEISLLGLDVYQNGAIISTLGFERTDARTKLVTVGSATATVVLLNNTFNANFYFENSASQVYEVRKAVINAVEWTDKLNQKFDSDDTPEYDFGSISGVNGPAFTALGNGTVSLEVTYNKTYTGDWVVDETVGYIAYAKLSSADAANYEFADGAEYFSITFFIKSVGGFKTPIDVTWVVFINDNDYVLLDQYLNDGGFVYNDKVQYPTPIYIKDNGVDYEVLELQPNSIGKNAGKYTARIKPSSVYNISEEDFTCDYEIKKLDIVISWQDGQYDSNTTFNYVYNGNEQAPYAYVLGTYDFDIDITVKGKTNAGTYPATAVVNGNFNITSGKTQVYTISKLGLDAGLVVWDFSNAGASGDATNGWYWIYDGNDHAPTAKITISSLGIELELVVTGKTSEIGTHSAYAVLNSSLTAHNNFYLIGTAETSFEIVQVKAGQVYWEDASGHTYEDGKGGDTGLVFTFNGDVNGQAPKAYYVDEDGNKVYLTVTVIGGTAVDAGTYTAYVSSDLDFDSAMPSCTFKIEAMEITVEWDGDTELTFNGEEQAPSVTLSTGADGYTLVEGVDYEIVGFTNAGKHTAEIKFLNNNYTCADTVKTFDFEIKKIELTDNEFAWDTTDGYDADTDSYFWEYDGDEHHPEVTINYAIDGVDVVFEIEYIGAASTVGNHKVTAVIKSATLNGVDITDNFVFEVEMEYVIKSVSVTIDWDWSGAQTGVDENGETYYFWSYDGDEHAPKAYLADADGNRIQDENGNDIELDVYGAETNARKAAYTATAVVPSEYNFTGDNTHKFFIMEATIEVNWDFTGATAKVDAEGNTYYEWTYGDSVTPKAYIKNADGTNGAELTVTGIETDAGTHTLTVMQNDGNYTFADASDASMTYVIVPKTVYVIWYGAGGIDNDDTTDFEWTYGGENTVPTAYLAYKDANGDLQLLLDEDNKPIKVEVSGASNEIGTHSAQVVDTFVNYDFASDAEITKNFTINEKEATNFEWNAEGAEVTGNATDGFTFTYEYSGDNNLPIPSSSVDGLEFNTTIVKVNDDGSETTVLSITEVGTYKVTVSSRDGNYKIPDGLEEITVVVTARTVEVEWDESELIYNGENQMPKAYYTDVDGNKVELEVTVVGNSANAGATYTATASQPSNTNYVLGTDITKDFEITAKTIKVEWSDNEFEYDGTAHASLPKIVLTSAEKDDITRIVYEITDKDGNVVAGTDENDKKVKNAGEYTVKVWLEGPAAANYQLDTDEYVFNINRKEITITAADDKEVNFGDKLTLTIDDVVISGLLADEAADITEELKESLKQWLICWYVQYSEPGEYTIFVDVDWLNDNLLANYKVVGVNGLLTVNPVDGELVWVADKYVEDEAGNSYPVFTYDGTNKLPKVYYFVGNEKHYLNDYVKLATYDEATGTYTVITDPDFEAKEVDTYYAVIVDNEGNIITEMGGYEFANSGVKFEIVKREIVINLNVDGFAEWKYGDVSDETVAELLGIDIGYLIGSTKPLAGDDLGIKLEIVESFENGFLNAGSYTIKIRWNSEDFGENYTITVVAGEEKITDVENDAEIFTSELAKAEIEVNLDKSGNYYFNDYIILTNGQHECDFLDNPEDFIGIAGYQGADVTIRFSEAFVKGEEPSLEGFEFTNDRPASITEAGEYVFLFKIVVDNHEEFTGTLLVKAVDKENVLYVTVKGNVEKSYGEFEVTDGLAKWLFTENYAGYDSDISPEAVTEEIFLKWVTATVFDEDNNVVTGKLGVGTYKVVFGLSSEAPEKYGIHVNDSKHVYIEITKFVLEIDWGDADNLNYTFDGETHMPVITLKGVTDEYGNPVTLTVGENLITVNGETVKLIVTVDGDFTAAGGHSVHVAVEDENFTIDEENALCSVSITEPATEVPAPGVSAGVGLEDWQLWLIIAAAIILLLIILILVIVLVKRRQAGDDDGFYDPVDESNL